MGIVIVDKPSGISSAAIVGKLKRIYNTPCGHFGTLDPMASGLLIVGVGKASRLFDYMQGGTKTYEAVFEFGYLTDTLDGTGEVTDRTEVIPTTDQIKAIIPSLRGSISQIPPAYSAKSIGGVRAYKLARKGQAVEPPPKQVTIYKLELLKQISNTKYSFVVECSSGTYIRSIARDIAKGLNSLGTMTALRRTISGHFDISDAHTVDAITNNPQKYLIPTDTVIKLPNYIACDSYYQKLINGVKIYEDSLPQGLFKLYCDNVFFGLAKEDDGRIKIVTNLCEK